MHMPEQLPHIPVSTSIAEERIVVQVDFLLVDLYVHLHACQFKPAGVPLPDIVFHLGDFCLGGSHEWTKILNRLNGKIYLILGNHDLKNIRQPGLRYPRQKTP